MENKGKYLYVEKQKCMDHTEWRTCSWLRAMAWHYRKFRVFTATTTIFQTTIPKPYHGRFFSLKNMLDRIMFQVVLLGTGFLLDIIGLENTVVVFSFVSLSLIIYFFIKESKHPASFQHDSSI